MKAYYYIVLRPSHLALLLNDTKTKKIMCSEIIRNKREFIENKNDEAISKNSNRIKRTK